MNAPSAAMVPVADPCRALEQIAYVAGELIAVREAGFTSAALAFPRSEAGLIALCAFNGIKPEQAPRGWHYWPNAGMKACWERVIAALEAHLIDAPMTELRDYVSELIERQRDQRGDYLYRGDADPSLLKIAELLDRLSPNLESVK